MAKAVKKYELTPEHRAQLDPWAKKWIANALSTEAMTDADRDICRAAADGRSADGRSCAAHRPNSDGSACRR